MGLGFSYVFTTFLKPIVAELGWTRTAFSAAGGPLLLSMALAAPLIGNLADRFGPRRVLALSTLLLAAALASFGAMQSLAHFYATSLLFGLALTGLGDIPVGAVASRWFAKSRGLVLGVVYVGSNIGGSLVPIAATAIAARASWRVALVVLGVAALALILPFALFVVREPRADERPGARPGSAREPRARPPRARSAEPRSRRRPAHAHLLDPRRRALRLLLLLPRRDQPPDRVPLGQRLLGSGGGAPLRRRRRRGDRRQARDRRARRPHSEARRRCSRTSRWCCSRPCCCSSSAEPGVLLAFLVVHGFAVAAENVLLPLIVVEAFGVAHMAQIYGALMFALLPGGVLGPIFAARLYDTLGSYQVAFTTFAVLNAASLALLCLVRRETAS